MGRITIAIGVLLIIEGVAFWAGAGFAIEKWTAVIPALLGLPVLALGLVACCGADSDKVRMHTAHVAVLLTTLGVVAGLGRGIPGLFKETSNKTAVAAALVMAGLCAVHVALSVRSFIAARKARQAPPDA